MGKNGVQVWDVAFMCQYLIVAGFSRHPQYHDMILKGYWVLRRSQFTEECVEGSYKDKRKGEWQFSTKTLGYTVSDCTSEALKAIIMVKNDDYLGHQIVDNIERQNLGQRMLLVNKYVTVNC